MEIHYLVQPNLEKFEQKEEGKRTSAHNGLDRHEKTARVGLSAWKAVYFIVGFEKKRRPRNSKQPDSVRPEIIQISLQDLLWERLCPRKANQKICHCLKGKAFNSSEMAIYKLLILQEIYLDGLLNKRMMWIENIKVEKSIKLTVSTVTFTITRSSSIR